MGAQIGNNSSFLRWTVQWLCLFSQSDGAQPLHTSKHHNGWKGPNPNGYTTSSSFHSFINGTIIWIHGLTPDSFKGLTVNPAPIDLENYFQPKARWV